MVFAAAPSAFLKSWRKASGSFARLSSRSASRAACSSARVSELSAWAEYQGLEGDLHTVEIRTSTGVTLGSIDFDRPRAGFASGVLQLGPAAAAAAADTGYDMHFRTAAFPAGEMTGFFAFRDATAWTRILDGQQVMGSTGALNATATMHMTQSSSGRLILSGNTTGLDLPFTGLELRGPCWWGENGPLVLDLAPYDQSSLPSAFFIDVPAGVLSARERIDLEEGFHYFLLRTANDPEGALRAQSTFYFFGMPYCRGRASCTAAIGATLELRGSPRISDGSLVLGAMNIPTGSFALPLAGTGTGHLFLPAGSQGILCLGGAPIARLTDHLFQGGRDPLTTIHVDLDLAALPPEAGIEAGIPLQFQLWFRDTVGSVLRGEIGRPVGRLVMLERASRSPASPPRERRRVRGS